MLFCLPFELMAILLPQQLGSKGLQDWATISSLLIGLMTAMHSSQQPLGHKAHPKNEAQSSPSESFCPS